MQDLEHSSIKPHLIIIAVIIVVLLVVFLWPSSNDDVPVSEVVPAPVVVPEPIEPVVEEPIQQPEPEPEVFTAKPIPEAVELVADGEDEPLPEPVIVAEEPEPLDTSDTAIKSALITLANNNFITDLLVNEALLQRFVVTVTNLAEDEMAPNHRLLNPPEQTFRVYQQAQRYWVDPASYKRYTPYIDAMEALDNERLITLFERYEDEIVATYEEISASSRSFNSTFIRAINNLLDTPEVPIPIEVYTDSVVYKYKDQRLENLNAPQKQLLRTGPDNMRRVKAKLRDLLELLESRS